MKTQPAFPRNPKREAKRLRFVRNFSSLARSFLLIACQATAGAAFAQGVVDTVGTSPFHPQAAQLETGANGQPSGEEQAAVRTARAQRPAEAPKAPFMAPTRSSFMADWEKVDGATGYRLDLSTDSSFTEYVTGYRDVDVGNTLGRVVFGLKPGTTYYYRVRPYNSNSPGPASPVTSVVTAIVPGLVINPTFDASILNDPDSASIQFVINQAIAKYQSSFTDPVTVSILFRYENTQPDGTPIRTGTLGGTTFTIYSIPWTTFINALKADAKTSNDTTAKASLPVNRLSTNLLPSSANGRAVGLNTPGAMSSDGSVFAGGTFDGIVTLNSDQSFAFSRPPASKEFDALTVIQHQIDDVLGLGSFLNFGGTDLQPEDLFSWSAAAMRSTKTTGNRYFSIDSGLTNIVSFSQDRSADLGAWLSTSCPQSTPYVQNAFICAGEFAVYDDISRCTPEGIALDVIGYDLIVPATYSPETDCNIVEWLKADDLSFFYPDGAFVTDWFAAGGSDLVPPFSDLLPWLPPTFKLNGLNGLPIVRTDGLIQWLNSFTFSPALPQPDQIFMVFRTFTTTDGYFFSGNSLVNLQVISVANGNWDFLSSSFDQHMGPVNTNWNVVFVEANGASSRYRFNNGVNGAFVKIGNPGTDGFSNVVIGAGINANGFPGGFTATDYAEIIVRRGTTDPNAVMTYLNNKWNVYSTASPTPTPTPGPTPQVSVSASPASVAHRGSSTITFKRSNVSGQAISVSYITGGTAILNSGYTLSGTPGKVTIPASQTSAAITLQSINNAQHAHDQNANIRVTAGTGYKVGSPANVTVTLLAY